MAWAAADAVPEPISSHHQFTIRQTIILNITEQSCVWVRWFPKSSYFSLFKPSLEYVRGGVTL